MICGPCLGWHGPKVARRAFGPCWAVVSGLRPSTARPGKIPCLIGPARFSPKHDGSVPCRPGTAQLSALAAVLRSTGRRRLENAMASVFDRFVLRFMCRTPPHMDTLVSSASTSSFEREQEQGRQIFLLEPWHCTHNIYRRFYTYTSNMKKFQIIYI